MLAPLVIPPVPEFNFILLLNLADSISLRRKHACPTATPTIHLLALERREAFTPPTERTELSVARGRDFATHAAEKRPKRRDACDDDADVNLHDRPLDDGLRVSVSCKVGDGLNANALHDRDEESKAVKKSQGNLLFPSMFLSKICERRDR